MIFMMDLVRRVKRGVALLDKKVPNWRITMRRHAHEYEFEDGECCILGTLEHYNGRMRTLRARGVSQARIDAETWRFTRARTRLGLSREDVREFGFDKFDRDGNTIADIPGRTQYEVLHMLWRAEFAKPEDV